jgi:MFS family permease
MDDDRSGRVGYGAAVASREFRALFAGQLVSVAGTSIAAVALTILVYRRTQSPLLSSLTFALGFLPYLFGGGLLSGVVDRVRPRRLVVLCNWLSAGLAATMAVPAMPVPALFALLVAVGTLSSVASGSGAALLRASVAEEAYVPARSLMRIAAQLAQIGGNAGGGALLLVLRPSGALLANAGSFAFAAVVLRLLVADHPNPGERGQAMLVWDSLRGAREVLSHAELRRLLLAGWLAPTFSVAPEALAAPYVAHHHGSSALVGWWLIALPVGLVAGDLLGVRFLTQRRQRRLVAPAMAAGFLPYLVFAIDPRIPLALALLVLSGACGLYGLGLDARVRDAAPPGLFARAMTVNSAGLMTLQGLGFALAGAVAQATGPAAAIALAGGCGLTSAVLLLRHDLATRRRAPAGAPRAGTPPCSPYGGGSRAAARGPGRSAPPPSA